MSKRMSTLRPAPPPPSGGEPSGFDASRPFASWPASKTGESWRASFGASVPPSPDGFEEPPPQPITTAERSTEANAPVCP